MSTCVRQGLHHSYLGVGGSYLVPGACTGPILRSATQLLFPISAVRGIAAQPRSTGQECQWYHGLGGRLGAKELLGGGSYLSPRGSWGTGRHAASAPHFSHFSEKGRVTTDQRVREASEKRRMTGGRVG